MTRHYDDPLFQAILDNPDDDSLRLVYADFLEESGEPERAAFIRVQAELARLPERDERRHALEARERALLAAHEAHWIACRGGMAKAWEFRRGFIESLTLDAEDLLTHADQMFRRMPLTELHLGLVVRFAVPEGWSGAPARPREDLCGPLARLPYLTRLTTLDLSDNGIDDDGLAALAASPHLRRLRAMDLRGNEIGLCGLRALLVAPFAVGLQALLLGGQGHGLGDAGLEAIASSDLSRLSTLDLYDSEVSDDGVEALVASALLASLTDLDLGCQAVPLTERGVRMLADSPRSVRLTRLLLDVNGVGDAGARALAEAPRLAGLTELGLSNANITDEGALALADSGHLAGLVCLNLRENDIGGRGNEALRARFGDRVLL